MFSIDGFYKKYTYKVITAPTVVNANLLKVIKEHLRLDPDDTSEDDYLTMVFEAVYDYAEKYTRLTFINTVFETYRDNFSACCFLLRRSPFVSITDIKYYDISNNSVTLSSDNYYVADDNPYAAIYRAYRKEWPTDVLFKRNSIIITFTAGYGPDYTGIPKDLLIAMLNHAAKFYESRGDCDGCGSSLPDASRRVYDIYKISELAAVSDCL